MKPTPKDHPITEELIKKAIIVVSGDDSGRTLRLLSLGNLPNPTTKIDYFPSVSAICAFTEIPFSADLQITYYPVDYLIEYESFERYLKTFEHGKHLIEDLPPLILDVLDDMLRPHSGIILQLRAATEVHAPVSIQLSKGIENR